MAGILFLLRPEMLKKSLKRESLKKVKKILFLIVLVVSFLLIGVAWNSKGPLSKIVMVLGIIGVFKGFFLLKAKAADKIIEWFTNQPLIFFRLGASLYILIGIMILGLQK